MTIDEDLGQATTPFASEVGALYSIEGGPDTGTLIELDDFTAAGDESSYTDPFLGTPVPQKLFYRVKGLP